MQRRLKTKLARKSIAHEVRFLLTLPHTSIAECVESISMSNQTHGFVKSSNLYRQVREAGKE